MNRNQKRKLAKLSKSKHADLNYDISELSELATNKLINDELDEAHRIYNRLLKLDHHDPSVFHFAGVTKYKLGKYDEALQLFNESIDLAPTYAEAFNSKGIVLLQQRHYEESKICFEKAIDLKPYYDNAYLNLGNAFYELGELSTAKDNLEKSLKYNSNNIEAAYKLASIYICKHDAKSALEYCDYSLGLNKFCQNALAYTSIASWIDGNKNDWISLYDFENMIQQFHIDVPKGFASIDEFNEVLRNEISNHPSLVWEPLQRVTNGGAVTSDLLKNPSRTIRLLEKSIRKVLNKYINELTVNDMHPFYYHKPNKYKMTLIGSILVENGVHPPHVHENSWLSGVYYINIPSAVKDNDVNHAGWLEFGRPDIELNKEIEIPVTSRYPDPGSLLIFPSYFFHGTIPFESDQQRLGIAFDLYPIS